MVRGWPARLFRVLTIGLFVLVAGCIFAPPTPVEVSPDEEEFITCQIDDFAGNFDKLTAGASRSEVTLCLGQPAEMTEYTLPDTPFFGPAEGLSGTVEPGTPVEEWLYYGDDQTYYLWFASNDSNEKFLVGKANYPTGAVFEAE